MIKNRFIYCYNILLNIGKPYIWGDWGKIGFDCSGLVCHALELEQKTDHSGLISMFKGKNVTKEEALPGTLFFYGDTISSVDHVMSVIARWSNGSMILAGARGGDSTTTTIDMAWQKNAWVEAVNGLYWLDRFQFALDPFKND